MSQPKREEELNQIVKKMHHITMFFRYPSVQTQGSRYHNIFKKKHIISR